MRRFSALGEHAAIWLALGAAGAAFDEPRRARWLRGLAAVGGAYVLNTAIKLAVRRRRPDVPGLPPLDGDADRPVLSQRPRHLVVRRARAPTRSCCPPAPLYALAAALGAVAAVPRGALAERLARRRRSRARAVGQLADR